MAAQWKCRDCINQDSACAEERGTVYLDMRRGLEMLNITHLIGLVVETSMGLCSYIQCKDCLDLVCTIDCLCTTHSNLLQIPSVNVKLDIMVQDMFACKPWYGHTKWLAPSLRHNRSQHCISPRNIANQKYNLWNRLPITYCPCKTSFCIHTFQRGLQNIS